MDLSLFNTTSLYEAATDLFKQLNIQLNSNTTESLPAREILKEHYRNAEIYDAIRNTYFIGIVDESIFREVGMFDERYSYKQALEQAERNYDGLMLFALELDKHPTRTEISDLTRSFNRISQKLPVGLLLKYENDNEAVISIAISERFKYKQNWRQGEKAGKVIILRDIHTKTTHAGHVRILKDLTKPVAVTNYAQLHAHWLEVLDVSILNKRFFQELANWYFWAMSIVSFPDDVEKDKELRNATNLIRLITRIIFIWFIKEKRLVPNNLFRKEYLGNIVIDFMKNDKSENYYHAILQNLFFGTLNQVIEERCFVKEGTFQENKTEYGVKNLFRYADKFLISEYDVIELFKEIPFLNGGLFDCLDKPDDDGKIIYVDGFSRNPKKQSHIPDYVFFTSENEVDLNEKYGTKNKRYKIQGLINLLESYKFTVAENTPIEEEIALDPELLGKVFENLLASYNPETKTTARKQTGSFYTPREIVNYMVDESLIEYLKTNCNNSSKEFDKNLWKLFSYEMDVNPFSENDTKAIIRSLNNCKILDPACGSGAFPMGILHKMVHLLSVLDSGNMYWKELQKEKAVADTKVAYEIENHLERKRRLDEIEDVFENNTSDYGRKLYLIENCIYGIDIQPVAVQISKLRFFISLIIDQNKYSDRKNFGIRSLPNLETKFVAANTLISLEKPQLKTGDIFLNDTFREINKLSEKLKEIRHKYFNAKVRTEKLKFQRIDKELRNQISGLLVKVGHTSINAHKIASFDPYDQNHYADWFDREWMFGLKEGFDILVGNPPYIQIKQIPEQDKPYYIENYKFATGRFNLFYFFIEITEKLSREYGISTLIVPDRLLLNTQCFNLRDWLLNNQTIIEIDSFDESIFDSAVVDSIIIIFKNKKNLNTQVSTKANVNLYHLSSTEKTSIPTEYFKNSPNKQFDLVYSPTKEKLIKKIRTNTVPLESISDTRDGIIQSKIPDILFLNKRINPFCKKLLFGKDINRYTLIYNNNWVNYQPDEMMRIELHRNGGGLRLRTKDIFEREKILTRQTADQIIGALDTENYYYSNTLHGTAIIDKDYNIKYVLALLNSKVINYYYRATTSEGGKVFAQIKIEILRQIPIKKPLNDKPIIEIVDKILDLKSRNSNTDIQKYITKLDSLIYKLYEINDEEIKIIEDMFET